MGEPGAVAESGCAAVDEAAVGEVAVGEAAVDEAAVDEVISAGLAEVAGPRLYRDNAFRITGLPTDAGADAVREHRHRVLPVLRTGGTVDLGHRLPVGLDDVRAAFDRLLGDPRRRLVDELFWRWNTPDATCPCPPELHREHDAAVLAHSSALDRELAGELTDDDLDELERQWARASRLWRTVLARAGTWAHVRHRITALADPRLAESAVDLLRERVPATLVAPLIGLAATATEEHGWLADAARRWPAPAQVVDEQLERVAAPRYAAARTALATAVEPLTAGQPERGASVVYERVVPALGRLAELVPPARHPRTARLCDEAAVLLDHCAAALLARRGPSQDTPTRAWLAHAAELAWDAHLARVIADNRAALDEAVWAVDNLRARVLALAAAGGTDLAEQLLHAVAQRLPTVPGLAEIERLLADETAEDGESDETAEGDGYPPPGHAWAGSRAARLLTTRHSLVNLWPELVFAVVALVGAVSRPGPDQPVPALAPTQLHCGPVSVHPGLSTAERPATGARPGGDTGGFGDCATGTARRGDDQLFTGGLPVVTPS